MSRVYNFSAGPSMLPVPVLDKAAAQMRDYEGSGMSVMEMSHRSKVFSSIIEGTESSLRRVMGIPDHYKVLFMQGGASLQFAAVPLNLSVTGKADYIVTGNFANLAMKEATKFTDVGIAATSKEATFSYIPPQSTWKLRQDADYVYICSNNTIFGTEYKAFPEGLPAPLVADASSHILSRPLDVTKCGLLFAGAQKNMGPAGLTVVIVREDLLGRYPNNMPIMLDYTVMAANQSMYNTPPAYPIYVLGLVLEWIEGLGGLTEMERINEEKAALLYDYLDASPLFHPLAKREDRSNMNVTFRLDEDDKNDDFCKKAEKQGFVNLKGHRSVGGMRASIYNAMPTEGVQKLVEFMKAYERENA